MIGPLLFVLSTLIAATALWIVRRDRFITFSVLLTYLTWHVPIVLMATMPFDIPIRSALNRPYVIALVGLIHLIVWAGVAGHLSAGRRRRLLPPPRFELRFDWLFIGVAYLGALFVLIDTFGFRTDLSLDIGANRAAYSDVTGASIFGQIGILFGGFALMLLLAKPLSARTFLKHGGPYLLYSAIYLLVGNRQFMLMGIILLTLTYVASRRPPLVKTMLRGALVAGIFFVLMTGFGAVRQSATKGVQDVALRSLMHIEIRDHQHPLMRDYSTRMASLYLYLYYGIEYEMAGSIMRNVDFRAPALSLTAPIIYRRYSGLLGLPGQAAMMKAAADNVEATLGVYPNVWATMFTQAYYEGGRAGVLLFGFALALANFAITRRVTRSRTNGAVNALTIFYACVIFGIMFAPTREGSITWMILLTAALALFRTVAGSPLRRETALQAD